MCTVRVSAIPEVVLATVLVPAAAAAASQQGLTDTLLPAAHMSADLDVLEVAGRCVQIAEATDAIMA